MMHNCRIVKVTPVIQNKPDYNILQNNSNAAVTQGGSNQ